MMVSRREIVGRQHKDHKIRDGLFSIDNRFLKPPVGVTNQPTHYWASRTCSVSPIQDTSNHTESGHVTLYNVWWVIIIMAPPSSWGWLLAGDCCWSNHTICKAEQTSLLQLHHPPHCQHTYSGGYKVWAIFWAEIDFLKGLKGHIKWSNFLYFDFSPDSTKYINLRIHYERVTIRLFWRQNLCLSDIIGVLNCPMYFLDNPLLVFRH